MSTLAVIHAAGKRLTLSQQSARYFASTVRKLGSAGDAKHVCNFCGRTDSFRPFGFPPRLGACCPTCGSLERHRMMKLWMEGHASEFAGTDVLHFAPEKNIAQLFRPIARKYLSVDIQAGAADAVANIEALEFGDDSYDCILCSHVLEHVDDRKAFREMLRVLRPGGTALILVPVVWAWQRTYENDAIRTPRDRAIHFGQRDHVRIYGADIRDRIRNAGFMMEEFTAEEPDVSIYGLVRGDKIFVCKRPVVH